jgi:hypothetical protein
MAPMKKPTEGVIKIWTYKEAAKKVKRLSGQPPEWVALVPSSLVCSEVEELFLCSHTDDHPVTRRRLRGGSVLFSAGHSESEH